MSIQASNAKIAVVVATLLAEVDAHGWLQGKPSAEATQSKFTDDTPSSRHQFFSAFETPSATNGAAYNNYVNAAENRVTRKTLEGDENVLHPTMEQCQPIWAGTEGACIMDENQHCIGYVNGKMNTDGTGIGVCAYSSLDKTGVYSPPIYGTGINTGCCGGWSDMKQFEQTLTTGGQKNTENGLMENGEDAVDENGKVRKSVCFTMDYVDSQQGHFGIPITNSTLPQSKQAALNVKNYTPELQKQDSFKVYTAGDTVDLSWVSTQLHGGMVEYSIVCDGNESYENFKANRLSFVSECDESDLCGMYNMFPEEFVRPNIISNGKGEKNGQGHWSFVPDTNFNQQSGVRSNAVFRTRSLIPKDLVKERTQCTLGWFWWGKNSQGVFAACSDVIIEPAVSGVRSN